VVNFINILREAFAPTDPKSAKKTDDLSVNFALLGYVCVKVASKTLMKLTPGFFFTFFEGKKVLCHRAPDFSHR